MDVATALSLLGVGLLLAQDAQGHDWPALTGPALFLICLINLLPAGRSRAPLLIHTAVCALWVGYIALGYWPVVNSPAALLTLHTVAAKRPPAQAAVASVILAAVWIYAGPNDPGAGMATVIAQALAWPAAIWRFGNSARRLAVTNAQLEVATAQLRREQEERARRAVKDERSRIARELHDVVGHHMSVISLQAGLADYVFDTDSATSRTALRTVAATSGEALQEMRRLLDVLDVDEPPASGKDEGDGSFSATPGLAQLPTLVDRLRTAGVRVDLCVEGSARRLSPGTDLCVYRIVQESLTNVLKHAGTGAHARVLVHYGAEVLTASVTDDGGTMSPDLRHSEQGKGGRGLLGMRERARLYGGTLTTAVQPSGGFAVRLTLPMENNSGS